MNDFTIRVLLIEDNPTDVLLLQNALETDRFSAFSITHVDRLAEALRQLEQGAFNVIVVDLGLPDSAGLKTFERIHTHAPALPIVIFSGNADEADALQAMRSGAQDYLIKSLGGFEIASRTIRYAVERHKSQVALRESEMRFARMFNSSPICTLLIRLPEMAIVDINQAALDIWGGTRSEMLGKTTLQLDIVDDLDVRAARRTLIAKGEGLHNVETCIRSKDGGVRDMLLSAEVIEVDHQPHLLALMIDITERKQTESELRLHSEIMSNMSEGINLVRASDNIIVYTNPRFDEMFGYQSGELLDKHISIVNAPTEPNAEDIAHVIRKSVQETGAWSGEVHNQKKNGELFWCFASVRQFDHPTYGKVNLSVQADITKLKDAQQLLAESEERHRLISSITSDYVYAGSYSTEGRAQFLWVSGAFEPITGYTPEEVNNLPRGFHSLVVPEDFERLVQSQDGGIHATIVTMEYRIRRKDGELRWLHDTARSLPIDPSQVAQRVGAVEDITERKAAEEKLRKSEERFFAAFHGSASAQLIVRLATLEIMDANEAYCRLIGLPRPELIGRHTEQFNLWANTANRDTMVQQWRQHGHVRDLEVEFRSVTGEVRILLASAEPIEINGERCLISTALDITDRKIAAEQLRQSEEQYRLLSEELETRVQQRTAEVQDLYDNAPSGYHSLDAQGRFLTINQTELNWLGYTRGEMLGRTFTEFVTPASLAVFQENFPRFKQTGQLTNLEIELKRKDGSIVPVLVDAAAIYNAHGEYVMSRSTLSDITQRKKAELAILLSRDELRVAYAALEKAAHAKDEFLATMSHELRTPLNGILGISEILLEELRGPLNDHQRKLVHALENSGRHLLSLINDVLDLSKIEAGRLELHPELIGVEEICQSSLSFVREMAITKGLSIEYMPDAQATTLQADPRQLKQILINLLNNAVKFTPAPGKVTLRVQAQPSQERLEFSIMDTGVGIAPADLQRLFSPFTQVDSSLTRQYEGTGLGLALVKRLVELHGGSVSVVSEVDQGSCFTVSLPWQPQLKSQPPAADTSTMNIAAPSIAPVRGNSGTILLAEDTETNIMMMGDYLEELGYRMLYAYDGYEALEHAQANQPDLILMDIQMPQMDGLEATRRLRTDPRFATTPIIALTALAMPGDRERCLEAGATDYVSKPVRLKQLATLIRKLMGNE